MISMNGFLCRVFALSLVLVAGPAWATTGGPLQIRVLGYDRADDKVFFLVNDGSEAAKLPRLHFFRAKKGRAAAPTVVRSWYEGTDEEEFFERLLRLQKRLVPLEPLPWDDLVVEARLGKLVACPYQHETPSPGLMARALAEAVRTGSGAGTMRLIEEGAPPHQGPELVSVCRAYTVVVRRGERSGQVSFVSWTPPAVAGAWRIPGSDVQLVVLRHLGITYESGYRQDVAVLLTPER